MVDDQRHVAYVSEHLRSAEANTQDQPDVAVMFARKAIEAMLRHVYEREVGDPGKHMLEHLLTTLRQKKALPPRAEIHFQTVRAFGNFESHAQSDLEKTQPEAIRPCMIALEEAAKWYFAYAGVDAVAGPAVSARMPARRRATVPLIAGGVVVAAGAVAAIVMARGGSGESAAAAGSAQRVASAQRVEPPPPGATRTTPVAHPGFVALDGTFAMGSTAEELQAAAAACPACRADVLARETPAHRVTLSRFELQAHEVTVGDFAGWVRAQPATLGADTITLGDQTIAARAALDGAADLPVTMVTYAGAAAYCAARGGALPTEAQWELAARGTANRVYPWTSGDCATIGCDRKARLAVGSAPNDVTPEGIHDLGGNVAELVRDGFAPYACAHEPCADPFEPPSALTVVRGGTFGAPLTAARAAERGRLERGRASDAIGFRCVLGGKP